MTERAAQAKTAKKPSSSSKKKPSAAKKKPSSSTSIRLSAAEKKLVQNYRKCNMIEKKVIGMIAEKASGEVDISSILGMLAKLQ